MKWGIESTLWKDQNLVIYFEERRHLLQWKIPRNPKNQGANCTFETWNHWILKWNCLYSRHEERSVSFTKRILRFDSQKTNIVWRTWKTNECSQMEKTRMYWAWGVWNDSKDLKSLEVIDCKEWWGCGERCAYSREGETLCWIEEYSCKVKWTWSGW